MANAANAGGWLHVAGSAGAPPDGSDVGEVIRWYRQREGLTQQDAAELLNTTQSRLSKLEKGSQALRDVDELRFIASKLSIPPERLGILPDHSADSVPQPRTVSSAPGTPRDSQERWKSVRAQMNQNRALLGDLATDLYPKSQWVPNTTVLTCPQWMPDSPVELSEVQLHWLTEDTAPPTITGSAPETEGVRPLTAQGTQYNRYSRALRDLARPRLLDNRISTADVPGLDKQAAEDIGGLFLPGSGEGED